MRKCSARPTTSSSAFCRQRKLPERAASRVVLSIAQLRGASCLPRDSVIGCGSVQRSWRSGSRQERQRPRRSFGRRQGREGPEPGDFERFSARKAGHPDECRKGRAEGWRGLASALARQARARAVQGDRPQARCGFFRGRSRAAQAHWRSRPAHRRPRNLGRVRGRVVEALRRPKSGIAHPAQLCGALGSPHTAATWLHAAQRDHARGRGALSSRTGSRQRGIAHRASRPCAASRCLALRRRVAADRAQPGQGREEAEGPPLSRGAATVATDCRAPARGGRREGGGGMGRETRP
jgi:hypothetical protein